MTPEEYVKNAMRTESIVDLPPHGSITSRLQHAIDGTVTESGEMVDALKKHRFYGKELDYVNLKEEAGDLLWYVAILIDELGTTFEEVMDINIDKLKARYPEKFTNERALNRDLDTERGILEQGEC